eukprot:jgi/Chlat1/7991/Chrsp7S09217
MAMTAAPALSSGLRRQQCPSLRSKGAAAAPQRRRSPVVAALPKGGKDAFTAAALVAALTSAQVAPAFAADVAPPPQQQVVQAVQQASEKAGRFAESAVSAPAVANAPLPEGSQWRYSEFLQAVQNGKVERVRFAKDGSSLQLTAVDGRRASVVVPADPDLVDILAQSGVDISVAEGDASGGAAAVLGNLLLPLLAFGGLFFLFRRAQGGGMGGLGGPGGPMDFGRSKSKFQEVPETGGNENPFLGQTAGQAAEYSMRTADIIDNEVRELVERAYSRGKELMQQNMHILHKTAEVLMEKETIDGEEFLALFVEGQAELYLQ